MRNSRQSALPSEAGQPASRQEQSLLPIEVPRPTSRREVRNVLILTLIFVVAANLTAQWILTVRNPNLGYALIQTKWRLLLSQNSAVDGLILGDSTGNQGVIPTLLTEQGLGSRWLNLCTIGSTLLVNDAWMLQTFIERIGPPKRVILVHAYDALSKEPSATTIAIIPLKWGFWKHLQPSLQLDLSQTRDAFLARYTPLYSANLSLQTMIEHPWRFERWKVTVDQYGFQSKDKSKPGAIDKDFKKSQRVVREQQPSLSEPNRQALEAILSLAEKYGFVVYYATGPIYESLGREPQFMTYFQKTQQTLGVFADRSARFRILLTDPVTFPKHQLTESIDHVTTEGARLYTHKISVTISELDRNGSSPAGEKRPGMATQ